MANATPQVRFDVLWRSGAQDHPIVSFSYQYQTPMAQYEEMSNAVQQDAKAGDLLVLTVTVLGSDPNALYVPYGDNPPTPTQRFLSLDIP